MLLEISRANSNCQAEQRRPSCCTRPSRQVGRVLKPSKVSPAGVALPVAEPGTEAEYFYSDAVHPTGGVAARKGQPTVAGAAACCIRAWHR